MINGRVFRFVAFLALSFLPVLSSPLHAQSAYIGIYNDASRSSCSLSDAGGGLIRAYVFVSSSNGMTGVRFSAKAPDCFKAVWIADESDFPTIGNSQTDLSIAMGVCAQATLVATIIFQKTSDTAACCQFDIQPASSQSEIQYADCSFNELTLAQTPAYINANETCPCSSGLDLPPSTPNSESPPSGSVNTPLSLTLSWVSTDPEGGSPKYDLYFGTDANPTLFAADLTVSHADVGPLASSTLYHWKVVAKDGHNTTTGPVWTFTTHAPSFPPPAPFNESPLNGAVDQPRAVSLHWTPGSGGAPIVNYEVHFGTSSPPPLVNTTSPQATSYDVAGLALNTTYYWTIVAVSADGERSAGATWSFRTTAVNPPPSEPVVINPANGDTHVVPPDLVLRWSADDPENQPLTYNLYFGTNANPPFLSHETTQFREVHNLASTTNYYWRVVAIDPDSARTSSPVWTFHTVTPPIPPNPPADPSPADASTNVFRLPVLKWKASDPEGQALHYTVFLGTSQSSGQSYDSASDSLPVPYVLGIGTTYYWRVTAIDSDNARTDGPWWTFTTPSSNLPPTAPANPDPANLATGVGSTVMLQWQATDPEGLPLHYVVCFGSTPSPPQIASGWPRNSFTMYGLNEIDYYWIIVAYDVDGNSTTGPRWTFHVGGPAASRPSIGMYSDVSGSSCTLADNGPGLRNIYVFLDGPATYTGARFSAPKPSCFNATWMYDSSPFVTIGDSPTDVSIAFGSCMQGPFPIMTITYLSAGNTTGCCQFKAEPSQVIGKMLATDCSFGELDAASTPIGISSDNSCTACQSSGALTFAATDDSCGTGAPHRMTLALDLTTAIATDNGSVDVVLSPELHFVDCERGDLTRNWAVFKHELNGNVLNISASGGTIPAGVTGSLALITVETECCQWTSPAELGLTKPLGDFQSVHVGNKFLDCRYPANGDVNNDGNLTLADAQCALESYLYWPIASPGGCGRVGAAWRADVNCTETPTPGDACCIYRQLTDHSCTFCNGDVHVPTAGAPQLGLRSVVENQDVVIVVSSSAAGSFTSVGLDLTYPDQLQFVRVETPRNDVFDALQARVVEPGRVRIGGYSAGAAPIDGNGDLIAVRFHARAGVMHGMATAQQFVDDLAGASTATVPLESTISAPVSQVVLHQNSPNPFNPETMIRFDLPKPMRVTVRVFDVNGRLVKQLLNEQRSAGSSTVQWNGTDAQGRTVATGVYFCVLDAGGTRSQNKMVLLK